MFQRFFGGTQQDIPSITVQEAWEQLSHSTTSKGPLLIDVREKWEYKSGHAKKARNIPLSQLQQHLKEIPRDREILVICQSGHRSIPAATLLRQQGLGQVTNVKGGTTMWRRHQLPME